MGSKVPPMTPRRRPTGAILRPGQPVSKILGLLRVVKRSRFLEPAPGLGRDATERPEAASGRDASRLDLGANRPDVQLPRHGEPRRVLFVGRLTILLVRRRARLDALEDGGA